MREEHRKRLALVLFSVGVFSLLVALFLKYQVFLLDRILRLLSLRRAPGNWA